MIFENLYEYNPETKLLVPDSLAAQSKVLASTLSVIINQNGQLDKTYLKNLGKHHKELGVTKAMYMALGKALINMLKVRLGQKYTTNIRNTWVTWYSFLCQYIFKGSGDDFKSFEKLFDQEI
eukprot:Pgem_evm1s5113